MIINNKILLYTVTFFGTGLLSKRMPGTIGSLFASVFSYLLVFICNDIGELNIEEHIITNILERLMFKPVPWGVLVTFSQLFRNQKYKLLERPFVTKNNLNEKLILKLRNFLKNDKKTANFIEYQNL